MSYSTAILILFICSALAVVVAAPFIYIARRRRRCGSNQTSATGGKNLSVTEALPGLLLVGLMFFAFAHQFITPDSWLGSRVTTGEGRFWFSVLSFLIVLVLNYLWAAFKRRTSKPGRE